MIAAIIILTAIVCYLAIRLRKKEKQVKKAEIDLASIKDQYAAFKDQYKGIIDVDAAITMRKNEMGALRANISNLSSEFEARKEQLNQDFKAKREVYEKLLEELAVLEGNVEDMSYGLYKPHFDYSASEDYKKNLARIIEKQKDVIRNETATYCPAKWTVEGSEAKGKKMVKEPSKLMLRAFNGECDAAIAKVTWSNIVNMEARIQKAYEAINKLGAINQITITPNYLKLKLDELYLEFELEQKIQAEKEEQRAIREQMREEEKALRELEKAQRDAEGEEIRYQKALEKARAEIEKAKGGELDKLNEKIRQLEENLQRAHEQKERAVSQAQLTKSGHVYIISNIGSFGDNVYKIGMTRRLEPMDRVKELGDASVPFDFDVHGMIYSENAPALENVLHKYLEAKRVNLVNNRAEFFYTTIEEIENVVRDFNLTVQLTKLAEAREYRESISIREARKKELANKGAEDKAQVKRQLESFPASLD